MISYKFCNSENTHVFKFIDGVNVGGGVVSDAQYLAWLSEGNTPEPADPLPNPRIQQIYSELSAIDAKSIRALREGNAARISELELQAELLRTELGELT